jgi:SOS-response transcriptional repressor LexA
MRIWLYTYRMVPLIAYPKPGDLTVRQWELFLHIKSFAHTFGYSPSQRQLAALMRCNHRAVQEILDCLERKGYIERIKGVGRGLQVLKDVVRDRAA